MIFTLFWKEWREHRTVWIAMALVSAAMLIGLSVLLDSNSGELQSTLGDWRVLPIGWATVVLAVTYGLVCGSMMFAGEREGRTLPFLDGLPSLRFEVWASKVVAGVFLTLAQSAILFGIVTYLRLPPGGEEGLILWAVVLPVLGCLAYSWGLFGSSISGSVLGAIGIAVLPLLVSGVIVSSLLAASAPLGLVGLLIPFVVGAAGIALSGLFFTSPDWERWKGLGRKDPFPDKSPEPSPSDYSRASFPWLALGWLTVRQSWPELVSYAVLAPFLGLVLPSLGWIFWPVGTLLIGVLCGTAVCRPEQTDGAFMFLGDQRVPAWQVWLMKVGFWGLVAALLSALFLIAAVVHIAATMSSLSRSEPMPAQGWYVPGGDVWNRDSIVGYALVWLTHGFAVGHVCGLIWRKSAVSVVLAMLTTPLVAALWLPSLLGGGLSWWQVCLGPVLILAATFFVERAWLSDRLFSPRPSGLLAASCLGGLLWLGGNIGWRWVEVPAIGEPFDVAAFAKSVFTDDQAEARTLLTQGMIDMMEQENLVKKETETQGAAPAEGVGGMGAAQPDIGVPQPPPPAFGAVPVAPDNPVEIEAIAPAPIPDAPVPVTFQEVLQDGWGKATPSLERWLDRLFEGGEEQAKKRPEWVRFLSEAAAKPPVTVIDCRSVTVGANLLPAQNCLRAGQLFVVRGMQLLAEGEEDKGLDCLVVALGLSRHLRSKAIPYSYINGLTIEKLAVVALTHWLQNEPCDKAVVQRAAAELARHEKATPPVSDAVKAEYMVMQNNINDPRQLGAIRDWGGSQHQVPPAIQMSAGLAVTASQMPWEKDRVARIADLVAGGWVRAADMSPDQLRGISAQQEISPSPYVRYFIRPWVPEPRGPAEHMTPERVAGLAHDSLLRNGLTPMKFVFDGQDANAKKLQVAREAIALALAAAAK